MHRGGSPVRSADAQWRILLPVATGLALLNHLLTSPTAAGSILLAAGALAQAVLFAERHFHRAEERRLGSRPRWALVFGEMVQESLSGPEFRQRAVEDFSTRAIAVGAALFGLGYLFQAEILGGYPVFFAAFGALLLALSLRAADFWRAPLLLGVVAFLSAPTPAWRFSIGLVVGLECLILVWLQRRTGDWSLFEDQPDGATGPLRHREWGVSAIQFLVLAQLIYSFLPDVTTRGKTRPAARGSVRVSRQGGGSRNEGGPEGRGTARADLPEVSKYRARSSPSGHGPSGDSSREPSGGTEPKIPNDKSPQSSAKKREAAPSNVPEPGGMGGQGDPGSGGGAGTGNGPGQGAGDGAGTNGSGGARAGGSQGKTARRPVIQPPQLPRLPRLKPRDLFLLMVAAFALWILLGSRKKKPGRAQRPPPPPPLPPDEKALHALLDHLDAILGAPGQLSAVDCLQVVELYNRFLDVMAVNGKPKPPHFTADEFAETWASEPFTESTSIFCAALYGRRSPSPESFRRFVRGLREAAAA
jgi:hypothetical protein